MCYPHRAQWCQSESFFQWKDAPPILHGLVCGKVSISGLEVFGLEYHPLEKSRLVIEYFHPDVVVMHEMRSIMHVATNEIGFREYLTNFYRMARDLGVQLIYLAMHERCIEKLPQQFRVSQGNAWLRKANSVAAGIAQEHNGLFVHLNDSATTYPGVCNDTED